VRENPSDLERRLSDLAQRTGAAVYRAETGWVEEGVNFGSRSVVRLRRPSIALVWDTPSDSTSAGAARFVLEREYGYPVTPVRAAELSRTDLRAFNVLILPDETASWKYSDVLEGAAIDNLSDWVSAGGTIIGIGSAVSFLASEEADLLAVTAEGSTSPDRTSKIAKETDGAAPGRILAADADFQKAIEADDEPGDSPPVAILRARLDPENWLCAGLKETVDVMSQGSPVYSPIKLDKGVNAAIFQSADQVVASGFLWKENRAQLAHKPLAIVQPWDQGLVIGFTADPNYHGHSDGVGLLFLNAVFRSSAHTSAGGAGE
jgi:hypothetical protein